jgi:hypothetical protein
MIWAGVLLTRSSHNLFFTRLNLDFSVGIFQAPATNSAMPSRNSMRRAGLMDLTLPEDLIWTVPVTPLEEQLPQPTRAPPQRIPILKCGPASTRFVPPSSP